MQVLSATFAMYVPPHIHSTNWNETQPETWDNNVWSGLKIGHRIVFVLHTLGFAIVAIQQLCILYELSCLHCKYSPPNLWDLAVIRRVLIQKGMCSYVEMN